MHPRANAPGSCCETCAAFDTANATCRRKSPSFVLDEKGNAIAMWPMVVVDDWCFDWLPADELGQAELVEEKPAPTHDLRLFPGDQPPAPGAPGEAAPPAVEEPAPVSS